MPRFQILPLDELKKTMSITPKRLKKVQQYISHLQELSASQGGKLTLSKGETFVTVRNDLLKASEILGSKIQIKRSGDAILFYVTDRKRGRRRAAVKAIRATTTRRKIRRTKATALQTN